MRAVAPPKRDGKLNPSSHLGETDVTDIIRIACKSCRAGIGVKPDQMGRRLRCPKCKEFFTAERPPSAITPVKTATNTPAKIPTADPLEAAEEAGQIVRAAPINAKVSTVKFTQSAAIVFDAMAFGIRRAGAEVLAIERQNLQVRFSGDGGEHMATIYKCPGDESEMDLKCLKGTISASLYGRIATEVVQFLKSGEPVSAMVEAEPRAVVRERIDVEDRPRRRKKKSDDVDGYITAGMIASVAGLFLFFLPIGAIPLGTTGAALSAYGLTKGKDKNKGLPIAGLVLGIVATVIGFAVFMVNVLELLQRTHR